MAYTVTIKYKGVAKDADRIGLDIARMFTPDGSYIDSAVYHEQEVKDDKRGYCTNVEGWGETIMPEPFDSTSIPYPTALAQFKLAAVCDDPEKTGVTFEVSDYKEAFFYQTIGSQMAGQGFEVTVVKNA